MTHLPVTDRVIFENRASTIIANLAHSSRPGIFLLPANICPEVPLAIATAGRKFEFLDIEPQTLCLDLQAASTVMQRSEKEVAGIVYVRTYGVQFDVSGIFRKIKEYDPGVLIVDDRCLCRPHLEPGLACDPNVDVMLFSTGYAKYVDLGGGGFAYAKAGLQYDRLETAFDADHQQAVGDVLRRELSGIARPDQAKITQIIVNQLPNWLNNDTPKFCWPEYTAKIEAKLPKIDQRKQHLNTIYDDIIPPDAKLGRNFNDWRYCIRVQARDELLRKIFDAGAFASMHYQPATGVFGGEYFDTAEKLAENVINLFNDHHISEEQVTAVAHLVANHLQTTEQC